MTEEVTLQLPSAIRKWVEDNLSELHGDTYEERLAHFVVDAVRASEPRMFIHIPSSGKRPEWECDQDYSYPHGTRTVRDPNSGERAVI